MWGEAQEKQTNKQTKKQRNKETKKQRNKETKNQTLFFFCEAKDALCKERVKESVHFYFGEA